MSNAVVAGRDAGLIRSVDRAVAILDVLAVGGWKAGAEVARELGVHRSTALRLLATLERHGLVERDQRTAKYRLGGRLVQLASAVRGEADLRLAARPVCEALARTVGETVTLDVLDGDEIVPVEQALGSTSVGPPTGLATPSRSRSPPDAWRPRTSFRGGSATGPRPVPGASPRLNRSFPGAPHRFLHQSRGWRNIALPRRGALPAAIRHLG